MSARIRTTTRRPLYALRQHILPPTPSQRSKASWFFHTAEKKYVGAASTAAELPEINVPQIVFIGRTNCGKTSLLRALIYGTDNVPSTHIIRPSSTPGSTKDLRFYSLTAPQTQLVLTDLPGYGYGSSSAQGDAITTFLDASLNIRMVYVLIDAGVGVKPSDRRIVSMLDARAIPWRLVGTKCDKRDVSKRAGTVLAGLLDASAAMRNAPDGPDEVLLTSATAAQGTNELRTAMWRMLVDG
ncbi:P-loop containing nucleoside triphosphate hydrolase protein [Limtongia smithiae]|uniref:P-loop containing nucleoside triphosphate hydrolase protein n=1 Tax=Limtongia smithiae TaxID=1125753 RepID=UPI0034CF33EC